MANYENEKTAAMLARMTAMNQVLIEPKKDENAIEVIPLSKECPPPGSEVRPIIVKHGEARVLGISTGDGGLIKLVIKP